MARMPVESLMTIDQQREAWIRLLLEKGIGNYNLYQYRGGGGFGLVFRGQHVDSRNEVAVKVLTVGADASAVLEFEDEAKLLRKMAGSSNVVRLLDSAQATVSVESQLGIDVPVKFHVLELASGCLDELLIDESRRNSLSWLERIRLWRGVVKGVHQMHLRNCAHRDLKSENCLLFVESSKVTNCKVSDLGRSTDFSAPPRFAPEEYWAGRGDLRHAPPEYLHFQGQTSSQSFKLSDLYGLGSILVELATGQAISSLALGFGPDVLHQSMANYRQARVLDLDSLRPRYEPAFSVFELELPKEIRARCGSLVRQICDPVPNLRLPKNRVSGRRAWRGTGLTWLLDEADIITRMLSVSERKERSMS